ncbi:hypothetical protein EAI_14101 [Harpegnathos saltator]|uniref:Uncharacterized protein n=1 Tax=Harpegnathos saltator TaxID=610380 RepID=E2BQW6_HARSA|nr:hypothetical protein EAI_14101 [Harpegnathos saltator]
MTTNSIAADVPVAPMTIIPQSWRLEPILSAQTNMIGLTVKSAGFRYQPQDKLIAIAQFARLFPDEVNLLLAESPNPQRSLPSDPSASGRAPERKEKKRRRGKENNSDRSHGDVSWTWSNPALNFSYTTTRGSPEIGRSSPTKE